MSDYLSGFAQEIESFVSYRKASGTWNEHASAQNLKYFDRYCADHFADSSVLTQEMVDVWCTRRDTETSSSCYTRTLIVREFVKYLCDRGMAGIAVPKPPKLEKRQYIPHAFTEEELARFFEACDSIVPYKGRPASVIRKLQCPVFFRLLYSSGMRTTEARYLKREDVDFKKMWESANGTAKGIVPYDVRHHYAVENINSWEDDSFTFSEKLHCLSKSMGHRHIQSTLYYYSVTPRLADKIQAKTEDGFNEIVPEVWDEED